MNRNQWTGPSHPDTLAAFDHVDAAMFTGDPAESRERFNLYKKYVDRWLKQLDEVEPRLIEKEKNQQEKLCVDAYRAGNYRPLQDVIDELRNSIVEPTFDEVIAEFRSGKLSVDRWNFVIQQSQFGKWDAYIMGEGSEQCLTYKSGFATKDEIYNLFTNLGVKRILSGVG